MHALGSVAVAVSERASAAGHSAPPPPSSFPAGAFGAAVVAWLPDDPGLVHHCAH